MPGGGAKRVGRAVEVVAAPTSLATLASPAESAESGAVVGTESGSGALRLQAEASESRTSSGERARGRIAVPGLTPRAG